MMVVIEVSLLVYLKSSLNLRLLGHMVKDISKYAKMLCLITYLGNVILKMLLKGFFSFLATIT